MLADDVADFRCAVRSEPGHGDDAVAGAGGVDDQRRGPEQFVERAARDVEVLYPDKWDDGVGVEQPAAHHLQQPLGEAVEQALVDALRGNSDDRMAISGTAMLASP
jgi:hypothetical protein